MIGLGRPRLGPDNLRSLELANVAAALRAGGRIFEVADCIKEMAPAARVVFVTLHGGLAIREWPARSTSGHGRFFAESAPRSG